MEINCIRQHVKLLIQYFNKYNVNRWLDFGTLLGCVREHDIIQWDTDADFSILVSEIPKVQQIIKEIQNNNKSILINDFSDYKVFIFYNENKTLHIDIYVWKKIGNIYKNIEPTFGQGGINIFPAEEIDRGFLRVEFLGEIAQIPTNFHKRLTRLYGDYWTPRKPGKMGYYWDDNIGEDYSKRIKKFKYNSL